MAARGALARVVLLMVAAAATARAATVAVVTDGYTFHAALAAPNVTWILLANNVTLTLETCPYPADAALFPATLLDRDVRVQSYSPAAAAEAAAAGVPLEPAALATLQGAGAAAGAASHGPFAIDCSWLDGRFELAPNRTLHFNSVLLRHCRTFSTAGFFVKRAGSTLVLNNTVDDHGSVCLPLPATQAALAATPRPPAAPALHGTAAALLASQPRGSQQQLLTSTAASSAGPRGGNWCAAALRSGVLSLPRPLLPDLLQHDTAWALCSQPALLLGDTAWADTPVATANKSRPQAGKQAEAETAPARPPETFMVVAERSAVLCPKPVSTPSCWQGAGNSTASCLTAAYAAVDPERLAPCAASDGFQLHNCLTTPSVTRILLLQNAVMNLTTCPSWLSEDPFVLERNITIFSDPRGPRMVFDCSQLTDRVQLPPGNSITLQHLILANCSIGSEKPLSIIRLDQGARLILVDVFMLQPQGMCVPLQQQTSAVLHARRPAGIPGAQDVVMGQPGQWCARQPGTRAPASANSDAATAWCGISGCDSSASAGAGAGDAASSNSSYGTNALPPLPQVYGRATGFGPAHAATLDQPSTAAYYVHPTWPGGALCSQQVLLLRDLAYDDAFGWSLPTNITRPALLSALQQQASGGQDPQAQALQVQDRALTMQLGPGYNGTVPVRYVDSLWVCGAPAAACAGLQDSAAVRTCLHAHYAAINPDVLAAAAAAGAQGSGSHGVRVVLPAVLGAVGGTLLLGCLLCLLAGASRRRRPDKAAGAAGKLPLSHDLSHGGKDAAHSNGVVTHGTAGLLGWLSGAGARGSAGSSGNPMRRLLGYDNSPAATGSSPAGTNGRSGGASGGTATTSQLRMAAAPDGIQLSMLLGAGSFGRVYAGVWNGAQVAVKIISHSAEDDVRISRELSLSLSFDCPNLVRALHYARIRINPNSQEASLGTPSEAGTGSLFLPDGAVGVFELPSTWAVIQKAGAGGPAPMIDTETWIVLDKMDRGTLAAAVRGGAFWIVGSSSGTPTGHLRAASLLRRAADIAAGMSYLHERNVCHGDLKLENVLLRTEPHDPDNLMAAIADFGLSRALAFGQSHLSTRRYGTVTHQPPELLVAGKLTPAADVYSFGIMMWEMVSRSPPFAGLHHGEVIHKVVTQDLRPGPWPAAASTGLPADYVRLAEACWARQASARPGATEVLRRVIDMLTAVEGGEQA